MMEIYQEAMYAERQIFLDYRLIVLRKSMLQDEMLSFLTSVTVFYN